MHLLVAEDEPRLARSYQRNLEDDGHSVVVAYDGESAFTLASQPDAHFDAIILDVLLPRRNGIIVCRDLRQLGLSTAIILLTALDQTEDKVLGLDAGADDYLTKPFPFEELLARLRALARRSQIYVENKTPTKIAFDDLVVDLIRHEVWRGERRIILTPNEFTLLELLARNANQVLTRQQVMEAVWPDGTEAGSNVLETYIHYLRDKIDRHAALKLIHTVRGVGYTMRLGA
jgi:DNA-binding response OmpR family regulator